MDVNPDKLNSFMGKMVGDMGAAANAALIKVGDRLGLYKALAAKGPMTPAELAKATGTTERCVREWLSAQAAAGYVDYEAASGKFFMQPEQKMALADEDSPVFIGAIGDVMSAMVLDEPKISEAFKTGKGLGWNERAECLFCGTARFFRTGYKHHLVQEWLPALDGVVDKLERGAVIVCDNLLWGGAVAEGKRDANTNALRKFNNRITNDPRLTTVVLPLGDGTGVSVVN